MNNVSRNTLNLPPCGIKEKLLFYFGDTHKFLLFVLTVFHIVIYVLFRYLNVAYQTWDSAGHLSLTLTFADMLRGFFNGDGGSVYEIATQSNYYPPLLHLFTAILTLILNPFVGNIINFHLAFMFGLFLFTLPLLYTLVIKIGFSSRIAFHTVFFYSMFPLVADQARLFHLETPLMLFLVLALHLLIASRGFSSRFNTTSFFIVFGAIQLTKWYGFLYLIVPVLYTLYTGFKHASNRIDVARNILFGSMLFLVIALPWYILNLEELRLLSALFSTGESDDPTNMFSIDNILYYVRGLISYQIYLYPFIASVVGAGFLFRKHKKLTVLILCQMLIVYMLFTFVENKNQRYVFGLNIPLAFFIAYALVGIKKRFVTWSLYSISIIALLVTSFNMFDIRSAEARAWGIILTGPYYDNFQVEPRRYSYNPYKPPIDEIFHFVLKDAQTQNIKDIGMTPLVDYYRVSAATLEMERTRQHLADVYMPVPYYQFEPFQSDYEIIKYFRDKNVSYVLVPDFPGPDGLRNREALTQAIEFVRDRGHTWFEQLTLFETIDNDIKVYRMRGFNSSLQINTCTTTDSVVTGALKSSIEPLSSFIAFTGHFTYGSVSKPYEPGTLYVLEVANPATSVLDVELSDLPLSGLSYCNRMGTKLRVKKEIADALLSNKYSCGESSCTKVIHTKIDGLSGTFADTEYTIDSFYGSGASKLLKTLKVLPLYEDEYSLKEEVFVEYSYEDK